LDDLNWLGTPHIRLLAIVIIAGGILLYMALATPNSSATVASAESISTVASAAAIAPVDPPQVKKPNPARHHDRPSAHVVSRTIPTLAESKRPEATDTSPPASAPMEDDLAAVRAKDANAAEHIASYCASATAQSGDPATAAATCRRNEIAAWTRLDQGNTFSGLDESLRAKCSQPPFPDSYEGKEACAKYESQPR
jgi:hypothetical protein